MHRTPYHSIIMAGIFCATQLNAADTTNVEARLKQLEQNVKSLQDENKDLKTQLGWDGKTSPVFVKPGGKESKISLGGFIQGQGEFGAEPDARFKDVEDRFFLRRARLNVTGSFAEHFDYKIEADFGANTLGEKSGFSAQLTDGYVNWNRYDFANVKFGQFKTPFGYEQLVSDTKLATIERSLANDRLTEGRQIGLGVAGNFLQQRLGYSVGVFNGTSVNSSMNDNDAFLFAGRITGVPFEGKLANQDARWSIGLDGLTTRDKSVSKNGFGFDSVPGGVADGLFAGDRSAFGVDTQFKWGWIGIEAEYLRSHFEPGDNLPAKSFDAEGWSVLGTCFIVPKKLQAVVKYESFDPNTSSKGKNSDLYTFGLTWFLKGDDIKVMANYLLGNPAGESSSQSRLLTRVQFVF